MTLHFHWWNPTHTNWWRSSTLTCCNNSSELRLSCPVDEDASEDNHWEEPANACLPACWAADYCAKTDTQTPNDLWLCDMDTTQPVRIQRLHQEQAAAAFLAISIFWIHLWTVNSHWSYVQAVHTYYRQLVVKTDLAQLALHAGLTVGLLRMLAALSLFPWPSLLPLPPFIGFEGCCCDTVHTTSLFPHPPTWSWSFTCNLVLIIQFVSQKVVVLSV